MGRDSVFPPEMPEDFESSIDPLDDDTAERLLDGRLHPSDAPRPYAGVAWVLRAAAAPPTPDELAGETAALAAFRSVAGPQDRPAEGREGSGVAGARRVGGRARLVAVALAGTLALGGLWMAAGAQTAPGLPSRFGGPGNGGSGSGAAGSGVAGSSAGGAGSTGELRPTMPGTGPVDGERPASAPADRDPADVRPGGAGTGGASAAGAHRSHPGHPHKPPKPKPEKPEPKKPKPEPRTASPRPPGSFHDGASR
jgi:hypothetical protein